MKFIAYNNTFSSEKTDEAGHTHSITMAEGYYLWIASLFVLFIGVIIYHKSDD